MFFCMIRSFGYQLLEKRMYNRIDVIMKEVGYEEKRSC